MNRRSMALVLAGLALGSAAAVYADPDRDGLVLIANRAVPASVELARHYAAVRGLPTNRICELDLPVEDQISRRDYERKLRDPVLAFLRAQGLVQQVSRDPRNVGEHESGWNTVTSTLRYLVPVYGVPLRIDDTKPKLLEKIQNAVNHAPARDEAAVDSELSLLLQDGYDLRGRAPNPFYNQLRWDSPGGSGYHLVMVVRLDGPDPAAVRRMVDEAVAVEKAGGLLGRAYFDMRGRHDDDYRLGDYWLEEAMERFRRAGFECVVDRSDLVLGDLYPMDDAAIYFGWYTEQVTGPFTRPDFRFRPGAVAYHNHSGNAKLLHTTSEQWAGPLLHCGAAVTFGAVSEPFLGFTPNLQILADRLCGGATFGESVYLSLSALSWQIVVVGDPLYRPVPADVEQQIEVLEAAGSPDVEWAYLRKINLLAREGRLNVALNLCREKLRLRESAVLREKLADLYAMNELYEDAEIQYRQALREAKTAETAMRIGIRFVLMLRLLKKDERAAEIAGELGARWPGSPFLPLLDKARP